MVNGCNFNNNCCYLYNFLTNRQIGGFFCLVPGSPPTVSLSSGLTPRLAWLTNSASCRSLVLIRQSPASLQAMYTGIPHSSNPEISIPYL
jgi:hypothetical protein